MLKTRIKASHISNLTDARYFAAWGVDWLGFDLTKGSTNYIRPEEIDAIKSWIEGPKIVGELLLTSPELVNTMSKSLNLENIQIGTFATTEELSQYQVNGLIKAIIIENTDQLATLPDLLAAQKPYVECFLLDFNKNNISWKHLCAEPKLLSLLKKLCTDYNILLDINLSAIIAAEILSTLDIYGFSIQGGEEEKVGFKSFDELDEIFEALEIY